MKRLVATGRCKTADAKRRLLGYLGFNQAQIVWLMLPGGKRRSISFSGGIITFTRHGEHWEFEVRAEGHKAMQRIHQGLTDSTHTDTYHWKCVFS